MRPEAAGRTASYCSCSCMLTLYRDAIPAKKQGLTAWDMMPWLRDTFHGGILSRYASYIDC